MCRNLAKQHVEEPDVPAALDGADRYAEWVQIALILFRVELEKSLRETEDYLNEMPHVLGVFDLGEAPHYSSFCRWEQQSLRRRVEQFARRLDAPAIDLVGSVEIDEFYLSPGLKGRERDRELRSRGLSKRGRGSYGGDKPPVFTLVDRDSDQRYAQRNRLTNRPCDSSSVTARRSH